MRCAGDVDGDGVSDIIVGAPWPDPSGNNSASAYVFSGATGLVIWRFDGDQTNDELSHRPSSATKSPRTA